MSKARKLLSVRSSDATPTSAPTTSYSNQRGDQARTDTSKLTVKPAVKTEQVSPIEAVEQKTARLILRLM